MKFEDLAVLLTNAQDPEEALAVFRVFREVWEECPTCPELYWEMRAELWRKGATWHEDS